MTVEPGTFIVGCLAGGAYGSGSSLLQPIASRPVNGSSEPKTSRSDFIRCASPLEQVLGQD